MIGLDARELKVFKKLTHNPQSVAELVRKTKMPRMTVYTNLLRLKKKRLVKEVKSESGKRILWAKNQESVIKDELSYMQELVLGNTEKSTGGISLYKGKKEVGDTLMELTTRKDGATMYSIQNAHNWWRWVQIMGKDWVNKHNRAVVKHKLVAFTIHSPTAPERITKDSDIIEHYKGRRGNSHAIPEQFLRKDLSFYIFDETIFLVNLDKVEATAFTNKDMSLFLIKMFAFMFEKADEEEFFLKHNR